MQNSLNCWWYVWAPKLEYSTICAHEVIKLPIRKMVKSLNVHVNYQHHLNHTSVIKPPHIESYLQTEGREGRSTSIGRKTSFHNDDGNSIMLFFLFKGWSFTIGKQTDDSSINIFNGNVFIWLWWIFAKLNNRRAGRMWGSFWNR